MKTKTNKNGGVATDTLEPLVRCRHLWECQHHSFGKQIDWCGKCGGLRITNHHCNGKAKRFYKALNVEMRRGEQRKTKPRKEENENMHRLRI